MFRSLMTIIRELYLYLTKVMFMLKHSVKLQICNFTECLCMYVCVCVYMCIYIYMYICMYSLCVYVSTMDVCIH